MNNSGEFVVTWLSQTQGGIIARQFALNGKATSSEILVNTTTGNNQADPDVAIDEDGDFAITWAAAEQDNGSMGVFAQRFNASGSKVGSGVPGQPVRNRQAGKSSHRHGRRG